MVQIYKKHCYLQKRYRIGRKGTGKDANSTMLTLSSGISGKRKPYFVKIAANCLVFT